jgi:hypothetical protein
VCARAQSDALALLPQWISTRRRKRDI